MPVKDLSEIDLLLASGSPRRRHLLRLTGLEPRVRPVDLPELILPDESGPEMVGRLAGEKAQAAIHRYRECELVLAADTTVLQDGQVIGKPMGEAEAIEMLMSLRQKGHRVLTAITLVERASGKELTATTATDLYMRQYDRQEVERYVASGSPFDKAGGYGIQDDEFRPVDMDRFHGCFTNVMGLPLCTLGLLFAALNIAGSSTLIQACFNHHRHELRSIEELLNA